MPNVARDTGLMPNQEISADVAALGLAALQLLPLAVLSNESYSN